MIPINPIVAWIITNAESFVTYSFIISLLLNILSIFVNNVIKREYKILTNKNANNMILVKAFKQMNS